MGFYIETNSNRNKASWIEQNCPGTKRYQLLPLSIPEGMVPVVVINNGPFEAAGIAFDLDELEAFTKPSDPRPREVLLVPREEVLKQCPHVEEMLVWPFKEEKV